MFQTQSELIRKMKVKTTKWNVMPFRKERCRLKREKTGTKRKLAIFCLTKSIPNVPYPTRVLHSKIFMHKQQFGTTLFHVGGRLHSFSKILLVYSRPHGINQDKEQSTP